MKRLIVPIVALVLVVSLVIAVPALGNTLTKWRSTDQAASPGCCQVGQPALPPVNTTTDAAEEGLPQCCLPPEETPLNTVTPTDVSGQTPVLTDESAETPAADCCD